MMREDREFLEIIEAEFVVRVEDFFAKWGKENLTNISSDDPEELFKERNALKLYWTRVKEEAEKVGAPIDPDIDKMFRRD